MAVIVPICVPKLYLVNIYDNHYIQFVFKLIVGLTFLLDQKLNCLILKYTFSFVYMIIKNNNK